MNKKTANEKRSSAIIDAEEVIDMLIAQIRNADTDILEYFLEQTYSIKATYNAEKDSFTIEPRTNSFRDREGFALFLTHVLKR